MCPLSPTAGWLAWSEGPEVGDRAGVGSGPQFILLVPRDPVRSSEMSPIEAGVFLSV